MKKKLLLLIVSLHCTLFVLLAQTQIIAHRGYWKTDGSAQNSLAALQKADSLNIYGSEVDVWLTSDGVAVVNHDSEIMDKGVKLVVQDTSYERLREVVLGNGENMPTLEEYLDTFVECENVKLILEFKSHRTSGQERTLAEIAVKMINDKKLNDRVEYIAFGINFINLVRELAPNAPAYYLNGDMAPKVIKSLGIAGVDYNIGVFKKYPEWVKDCHDLGLKVNVWTVNSVEDLNYMLDLGVDFITTDEPAVAKELTDIRR